MRRWLLVALLFVLPLQMVWAAAAPYCSHETKPGVAAHFGHHEHEHQGTTPSLDVTDDGVGLTGGDVDCGSCHLSTGTTLPSSAIAVEVPACAVTLSDAVPHYRSHTPPGPERPNIA